MLPYFKPQLQKRQIKCMLRYNPPRPPSNLRFADPRENLLYKTAFKDRLATAEKIVRKTTANYMTKITLKGISFTNRTQNI